MHFNFLLAHLSRDLREVAGEMVPSNGSMSTRSTTIFIAFAGPSLSTIRVPLNSSTTCDGIFRWDSFSFSVGLCYLTPLATQPSSGRIKSKEKRMSLLFFVSLLSLAKMSFEDGKKVTRRQVDGMFFFQTDNKLLLTITRTNKMGQKSCSSNWWSCSFCLVSRRLHINVALSWMIRSLTTKHSLILGRFVIFHVESSQLELIWNCPWYFRDRRGAKKRCRMEDSASFESWFDVESNRLFRLSADNVDRNPIKPQWLGIAQPSIVRLSRANFVVGMTSLRPTCSCWWRNKTSV